MSLGSKIKSRWMAFLGTSAGPALDPSAAGLAQTKDDAATPLPWWQKDRYIALLFFAVILLVYSRALNGAFIWDDDKYISENPAMYSPHGLWQIWFEPLSAGHQYYPLSFTAFWAGFHLWGLHTAGYHLLNIFCHAAASVLLWQILKRLKVPGALLAGALFALHPVSVMSAAWMNELKNTLSCALALGSIWAYVRFEGLGVYAGVDAAKRRWSWYAAAIVLFLLAMLAKTAVSFLPVSLLLILWWRKERLGWRELWPLLPMAGVVAGMGLLTIYVEHHASGATGKDFSVSFAEKIVISGHSFFFYLWKLLVPLRLSFVYPRWEINVWNWREYLWPVATVAVLAGLWLLRRRIGKGPFAAAMHFYICTSLLVFMVVVYRMRYSFVSDHWQYFGSMSVFALMGAGLAKILDALGGWENRLARGLAIGLFSLLGAMSWWQCGMYDDYETLWRWTIARNPGCWMAENNLGNYLLRRGHKDEAIGHLQKAIALKADYVLAIDNLGDAFMDTHRVDDAIAQYRKALAIKPDNELTLFYLGHALELKGGRSDLDEAIGFYQKALEINPVYVPARLRLAKAFVDEGRMPEAIDLIQKTVDIVPDYPPALNDLANLLATSRDASLRNGVKAVQFALKANELTGGRDPVLLDTLAAAYADVGRFPQAVQTEWRAMTLALEEKNTPEADLIRQHITLYQAGQPLRDK